MAVSARFNQVLRRLLIKVRLYHEAPRTPESVSELGARRAELEDARLDVAEARERDGLRYLPPRVSPRYVDPSIGGRPASRIELVGVAIGGLILIVAIVVALFALAAQFGRDGHPVDLVSGSVSERLEGSRAERCRWTIDFALAESTDGVSIVAVDVTRADGSRRVTTESLVQPGLLDGTRMFRLVYEFFDCPSESFDEIHHGRMRVTYTTPDLDGTRTARLDF